MDATSAQLPLDNKSSLVIIGDKDDNKPFVHPIAVDSHNEGFPVDARRILGLYFSTGKTYSDSCRDFEEESVLIKTESGNYFLYSKGEDYAEHQLRLLAIEHIHSKQMDRRLAAREIQYVESFHTGALLSGFHFLCDGKHLYFLVTGFARIKLFLSETAVNFAEICHTSECMKVRFGDPGEAGFGALTIEEDRRELFALEKKRLDGLLKHGVITQEDHDSILSNMGKKMKQ